MPTYTSQVKFFLHDNVKGLAGLFPVLFGCLFQLLLLLHILQIPPYLVSLSAFSRLCLNLLFLLFHSGSTLLMTAATWESQYLHGNFCKLVYHAVCHRLFDLCPFCVFRLRAVWSSGSHLVSARAKHGTEGSCFRQYLSNTVANNKISFNCNYPSSKLH